MPDRNAVKDRSPDHAALMDKVYRRTRHVYDLSRKYFLFGRDRLIRKLDLQPGETLCEVGCGTARNLVQIARRYPGARLCGFDASSEMLETAAKNLSRAGLDGIPLTQAYAEDFEPSADLPHGFGVIDHFVFSFCLTMIPDWRAALDRAWRLLPEGGSLSMVDFADLSAWPAFARRGFFAFLAAFHVTPSADIHNWAHHLPEGSADIRQVKILGGYTILTHVTKKHLG